MSEKKYALNMPEGTGLMAYLEKGERAVLGAVRPHTRPFTASRSKRGGSSSRPS